MSTGRGRATSDDAVPIVVRAHASRAFARRLLRDRVSAMALFTLIGITVAVLLGPMLWTVDPTAQDLTKALGPPSREHPLGTDENGRDALSRVLAGGRVSLFIAFATVLFSTLIAAAIGIAAGFVGGFLDSLMMRLTDLALSIPFLLLAMAMAVALGSGVRNIIIVLTIATVPYSARIIRSVVISVRERDYVFAARACGVRPSRIMTRHVLANSATPIVVTASLNFGQVLLAGAGLGFLGLGVQPPDAELGAMLANARSYVITNPLMVAVPGLAIFLTAFASNLVGDAVQDALEPSAR